ncbi:M23 family metallopeptidase [Novosphingobium sp. PC22D]|uniref:M23 family metallopeptidase n=1 Tax=Novosphingobium sp. PC22D TaxID=1962403 RepID=UPI00143BE81F|nr:M23 family metallopeptidase [Novosphingobium sp. PC22D]
MRSRGQVRFIKISSRLQILAASIVALLVTAWIVVMATLSFMQYAANRDRVALLDREAKVASAESRVEEYRDGIDTVASDLARRQDFIEKMVEAHLGDLPSEAETGETVTDSRDETARTVEKISAALPEAGALARIEADQLAFVERLTRYADRRAESASDAISRLGLNPNAMVATVSSAEGGPLMRLATSRDGSLDPRFQRLGMSLARMDALERSLAGIPQVKPTKVPYVSSSYGYRSDPFTGVAAFHAGLDFPGPLGSQIYAAAKGTVSFVGRKQGYGNCIEINHGNGLMTRYAHLSRFGARVGQKVGIGDSIGAMGSSGRSTGSHLHFEVRVNGRPVNPRPFLEAAGHVRKADESNG